MMHRRHVRSAVINDVPAAYDDYAPDPVGTDTFQDLSAVHQQGIDGRNGLMYSGDKGSPEKSFNGDLGHDLQKFTGAAALALYGAAKPIHPTSATFETGRARDALNDAPMRIFAARAARKAR